MKTNLTHAGYFEGIGGFSLAAERAGIETIYTCENDEFRHDWLKYRFPHATHEKNINQATGCYADIFTAGFPCQDISNANTKAQGLQGERSGLFFVFMQYVLHFRPRYCVLENSPNVVSKRYLLDILTEFTSIGYNAEWQIISKHPFGYPDERERFILVAYDRQIGRNADYNIFNRVAFEICIKALYRNEFFLNKLSRKNSARDWFEFISGVCADATGISKKMAAKEIEAYGDAVCPDVAQLIFELIKMHHNNHIIQINK